MTTAAGGGGKLGRSGSGSGPVMTTSATTTAAGGCGELGCGGSDSGAATTTSVTTTAAGGGGELGRGGSGSGGATTTAAGGSGELGRGGSGSGAAMTTSATMTAVGGGGELGCGGSGSGAAMTISATMTAAGGGGDLGISLSNNKHQVLELPMNTKVCQYINHFVGRSMRGVHYALIDIEHRLRVWFLNELYGQMTWELKHDNDLSFLLRCQESCIQNDGPWTLHYHNYFGYPSQNDMDNYYEA
uniref:Uncharacterized protein n=2 Tax=Oryza sativa subsp. japonica TaxID=39947 RepID=Q60DK8_ORYSJ|nr:hypothetical protein LOC_Os03g43330 [Oryza sativa Japonica Group]ABF97763.1 hypothetical protein LOC_Os03g43330 [Oryza sativa Japonica Group]